MDSVLAGWLRAALVFSIPVLYLFAAAGVALGTLFDKGPLSRTAEATWRRAQLASLGALGSAVLGGAWLTKCGPATVRGWTLFPLGALGSVRLSTRIDALSSIGLLLVSFIGWIIVRYSQSYLAGERQERRYLCWLMATLGAVTLLLSVNNLAILAIAWIGVSVTLHQLLTFYRDRPMALLAAHKKFLISRLADVCLTIAITAIGATLGTLEIDEVLARMPRPAELPVALKAAAVLIVVSSMLKCAQLPVHGWLIQVMEAPTPVSALLHAGVVNLGGFVLIRMSGLISCVSAAQWLLLAVGGLTATLAGLVMMTRISIKVMLAWSTCAQLGFMLLQCGLGAYDLALLHLIAHSLYKAHAFLSAGATVEQSRLQQLTLPPRPVSLRSWSFAGLTGIVLVTAAGLLWGIHPGESDARWAIGGIISLALAPLFTGATVRSRVWSLGLHAGAICVVVLYFGLHRLFARWVPRSAWSQLPPAGADIAALLCFGCLFLLQGLILARQHGPIARRLYPWFYAGLHLDERFTRLTLLLWPQRPGAPPQRPPEALAATIDISSRSDAISDSALEQSIERACSRIAPTWPLDRFIAVNPYLGLSDRPIAEAAAQLQVLSGSRMVMPREYYREQWRMGRLRREHLEAALAATEIPCAVDDLIASLTDAPPPIPRVALFTEYLDARRDLRHAMPWHDYVTQSISQFCAAWFDRDQAVWTLHRQEGMYATWLRQLSHDLGPRLLMGFAGLPHKTQNLPGEPRALIAFATRALRISEDACAAYLSALLLSINGWAAWCAYEGWQAKLADRKDESLVHLLAIRLAWECLLAEDAMKTREMGAPFTAQWAKSWDEHEGLLSHARLAQQRDWLLQRGLERAYQERLCRGLLSAPGAPESAMPKVQAVFCIDVRSEVFRRALESCGPGVQTLGFAGFFGLPIDYTPLGTAVARPQLPGLLAPRLNVTEVCDSSDAAAALLRRRSRVLELDQRWRSFRTTASSGFSFVESTGLFYAAKLLTRSLRWADSPSAAEQTGVPRTAQERLRPRLPDELDLEGRCNLAAGILNAMGLTEAFAPLVLLCGHGSQSVNNPHAAGLDCGACGGQTGEVNARVLAALLNATEVRQALRARGIAIPDSTWFVPGLHNTTTDEVRLFELDLLPDRHRAGLVQLQKWLEQAGERARRERASTLGILDDPRDGAALHRAVRARASDWSQVRPEWGLAANAALIIAPRARSRHLNLAGRAFLHEYEWRRDPALSTLELILTAPMIVASWINLQYYASTVDNRRYGSGNKVLHNVACGRIGVFEGNGGDLRIGLPVQSLHDGEALRHTPLRLSVFVEAPQAAIEAVLCRHAHVRNLIDHDWLYLFQIDAARSDISRYRGGRFEHVAAKSDAEATHPHAMI